MTKLLPPSFGPPSAVFGDDDGDKLSKGISLGYPILRIKGKVFAISRGSGEPVVLMRPGNDGPRNAVDVVILSSSQYISKMWYENGYEEGSTNPPECFSTNGIVPDASSTKKQNNTCADCQHNKWGSKITPAGKKAKSCTDSKRIAVAPLGDIRNEAFGGPMLLRVPAASLTDLADYGNSMDARGYRYYALGTKISFETSEAYPKLNFDPVRALDDQEAMQVMELRRSEVIKAILQEGSDHQQEAHIEATVRLPPNSFQGPAPVTNGTGVTPKVTTPPPPAPAADKPKPAPTPTPTPKPRRAPAPAPAAPAPLAAAPPSDGFGGFEPTSDLAPPQTKVQAAAPPPPAASLPPRDEEPVADGSFEASLDARLNEMMPNE